MTPKSRGVLEEVLEHYRECNFPGDQQALIALLREIQEAEGCVSDEMQKAIASALSLPAAVPAALVRRIPGLKSQPSRHHIVLCTGPRCMAAGASPLLRHLESKWSLSPGGTSGDLRFYLRTQNCMKHCGSAPNMQVDDDLYSRVSPEQLDDILEKYQ